MRTKRACTALIITVLSCSLLLTSCDAITAQNITSADFSSRSGRSPGMNGGTNFNGGGRGMERGSPRRNSTQGTDGGAGSTQ
jgi:hypothetical protein